MLRDHRPLMVTFADKAAVRDYVASTVGAHVLPELFHLFDDPKALADAALPSGYVVKPTHGSGVAIIVSPMAVAGSRLPDPEQGWVYRHVRPEFAPAERLVALGNAWLAQLYGQGPNREWAYGQVPRRIIVERLLIGAHGASPTTTSSLSSMEPVATSRSIAGASIGGPRTSSPPTGPTCR